MAATLKVSPAQVLDALTARPGVSAAELADALGLGQSTAAKHLAALEAAGTARREPGGRDGGRRLPDRWTATAPDVENPTPDTAAELAAEATEPAADEPDGRASAAERLGRGALGTLVRDYLAARPGEDLGPTQVAKGLGGKSSGAVSNALARLEASGEACLVSTSPRRYRIVADR
jgi:predicted ArsR family transcriptional regulator